MACDCNTQLEQSKSWWTYSRKLTSYSENHSWKVKHWFSLWQWDSSKFGLRKMCAVGAMSAYAQNQKIKTGGMSMISPFLQKRWWWFLYSIVTGDGIWSHHSEKPVTLLLSLHLSQKYKIQDWYFHWKVYAHHFLAIQRYHSSGRNNESVVFTGEKCQCLFNMIMP